MDYNKDKIDKVNKELNDYINKNNIVILGNINNDFINVEKIETNEYLEDIDLSKIDIVLSINDNNKINYYIHKDLIERLIEFAELYDLFNGIDIELD